MKFSPTYGATPATVGMMPRYKPLMPPSVLYILTPVAHMPGSFPSAFSRVANEADWIDSLVRMMSRGYVNVTEVIPAQPPHIKRLIGVRSAPGLVSAIRL